MLINFSNHPSGKWEERQIGAAKELYGEVVDIPFPAVSPDGGGNYIKTLAEKYLSQILSYGDISAVHIMGEMTLCFCLIKMLQARKIKCIASTSVRNIVNGVPLFRFERFREYL